MELFFNLAWLALSSALVIVWLMRRNHWADETLRSTVGVQLIALALLVVVLLPVVSLTDDLQACTMPAESEHLARRSDFQAIADLSMHALAFAIVGAVFFNASSQPRTVAWLSLPPDKENPCAGYLRILGSRPPPAV